MCIYIYIYIYICSDPGGDAGAALQIGRHAERDAAPRLATSFITISTTMNVHYCQLYNHEYICIYTYIYIHMYI